MLQDHSPLEGLALEEKVFSVSEINRLVKQRLEAEFEEIWVEGEISNFRAPASGHYYFSLKDETSRLRAVMFHNKNALLPFVPDDGMLVLARGRLTLYEPRGDYQIQIYELEPRGEGALQLAFEQLKKKLQEEGLFDQEQKQKLPLLPQRIGIVTSPTGAAIRDVLRIISNRFANVEILVYPVRVQGERAGPEIATGIEYLNQHHSELDVLLVTRGGGSLEDLWAFNEEVVARALFHSKIPTVSAVGHEIDFTIADFVADVRASTPSAAAEIVVQRKDDLLERMQSLSTRLVNGFQGNVSHLTQQVISLAHHRAFRQTEATLNRSSQWLDEQRYRLFQSMSLRLAPMRSRIDGAGNRLATLNPWAVLERGYSLTVDEDNRLVSSVEQINVGANIHTILSKGRIVSTVTDIQTEARAGSEHREEG